MASAPVYRDDNTISFPLKGGEIQLNFIDGQTANLYEAVEVRFHAPSEHTYLGQNYDLEMQVYHNRKGKNITSAVISVFFDRKRGGNSLNDFLESL